MTPRADTIDFILLMCSPRSCSSVVSAMLGQHPQLYAFPELNLFLTDTVGELYDLADVGQPSGISYLSGLLRSVAQLEFSAQTEEAIKLAALWLRSRRHWTTSRLLDWLEGRISPKIGVDKSPRTCLSYLSITHALDRCPNSRIVHLTRHPISTLGSLLLNHRLSATPPSTIDDSRLADFYARLWIHSQELILKMLARLNPERSTRIQAEDVLQSPDVTLTSLTKWLGIDETLEAIEQMKHPEGWPYASLGPAGISGEGDASFLRSPKLRQPKPVTLQSFPPEWKLDPLLARKIDHLSRLLGYESCS